MPGKPKDKYLADKVSGKMKAPGMDHFPGSKQDICRICSELPHYATIPKTLQGD